MPQPESILIVKLSAIGDVVHALPLLEVLRYNLPEARIDWLVEEEASGIIRGHKALDRVIVSRRKSWRRKIATAPMRSLGEILRFVRTLRSREYDLVIDLQGLLKSGILIGLSRAKRKIGFSGGREGSSLFLSERPFRVDSDQHALRRYLRTADYLGYEQNAWSGALPVDREDQEAVDRLLEEGGLRGRGLVAFNPMARWKTKLWDPGRFARLADRIQSELSCRVLFTGGPGDREAIRGMVAGMRTPALNLAGQTSLKELAWLYTRCRLVVSTDTGSMHIAAAMGCPVVALFGPTAPWRTGPYGKGHRVVREEMACSPCFRKTCDHRTCMRDLSVDRVFEEVREILESSERRR